MVYFHPKQHFSTVVIIDIHVRTCTYLKVGWFITTVTYSYLNTFYAANSHEICGPYTWLFIKIDIQKIQIIRILFSFNSNNSHTFTQNQQPSLYTPRRKHQYWNHNIIKTLNQLEITTPSDKNALLAFPKTRFFLVTTRHCSKPLGFNFFHIWHFF